MKRPVLRSVMRVGFLLVVWPAACTSSQGGNSPGDALQVREILLAELNRQAGAAYYPFEVDKARVTFVTRSSKVVPGLVYNWALFRSRDVSHGLVLAVSGTADQRSALIRTPKDWMSLARTWRPGDAGTAIRACYEIAQVTRDLSPYNPSALFEGKGMSRPDLLSADTIEIKRHVNPPLVVQPSPNDSTWHVDLWVIDPSLSHLATRYKCDLPTAGRELPTSIALNAVDSIVRSGPR